MQFYLGNFLPDIIHVDKAQLYIRAINTVLPHMLVKQLLLLLLSLLLVCM